MIAATLQRSAPARPKRSGFRLSANSPAWPVAGIVLVLMLQFPLIFNRAINWDEFYHYSLVQLFTQGVLTQPFQTFFVRLFAWLPALPGSSIDHIVIARLIMFGCEMVAAGAIAILATRFSDRTVGLLCALCYLSAGFVLQHGFSFRADPMAAALLMSALCILGCTRLSPWAMLAFAVTTALAAIITIKVVLYAPAFAGLAWARWQADGYRAAWPRRIAGAGVLALLCFAVLFLFHTGTGPAIMGPSIARDGSALLEDSADKMFRLGVPFYWIFIVKAALLSPIFTVLILCVPVAVIRSDLAPSSKIAIWGLFLPVLLLAFYQNTAPYFYTFLRPPVAVACAVPMVIAVSRYRAVALAAGLAAFAVWVWSIEDRGILDRQRTLIVAADTIFPDRISYFDFCAMLARHDKANSFMTPWGAANYRQGSVPTMRAVMRERVVPLVVDNDPMFTRLLQTRQPTPEFLPDDAAALRETYLPFWGPFWVAGKIIPAGARGMTSEILVPGVYTLSGGAAVIDGKPVRANAVVMLTRGEHRFSAVSDHPVRLTWGDHLRKPVSPPPPQPYWTWF